MSNAFSKAIRDVRAAFSKALDVSDSLLDDLQVNYVITQPQHADIRVRCFTVFTAYDLNTQACVGL